jgi:hypothetical protein
MDTGDDHRAVKKNGHDQHQDRAIKELHAEFKAHIGDEEHHHHVVERGMDAVAAKMDKYIFGGRVAWGFIGILGTIVLIYQASLQVRITELETRVDVLSAKQHAFEERGTKWGEQLDDAVQEIRQDIREIRRAVNGRIKE